MEKKTNHSGYFYIGFLIMTNIVNGVYVFPIFIDYFYTNNIVFDSKFICSAKIGVK